MSSADNLSKTRVLVKPLSKILNEIIEENKQLDRIGINNIIKENRK
jgi:hypothetical protein